ncbi:dimethylsulfonioproprionate lyase family protein [Pseudoroseicyclus tamaricis]|uniref:Transcriptional regulator n=1 Tax=Pseudoroseicyclus tamaricis TaxID=2705421 RepID=A0A6B2JIK4_9RHOB|nr:dimethylsulfonioproprionate lyase family protein [Pseudoroseicyclus tamaricis]NDV01213.1 transcriptional regulator [Pseudoroseicyclus tamaricis]
MTALAGDTRPDALSDLLSALSAAFRAVGPGPEVSACLDKVEEALGAGSGSIDPAPLHPQTAGYLPDALKPARAAGGPLAELAEALAALDPQLAWRLRGGEDAAVDDLPGQIANAMIVGPGALEERRDVWVGASLLPPGAPYPEHRHAPEEIYLFLTPGLARHGQGDWHEPGVGGVMHNVPNTPHALQAPADAPMLTLWMLHDPGHG